jgi:hypothetical protein
MRQHSIDGMGGRPRWRSAAPRVLPGREIARQAHPGRHAAGAGPLSEVRSWGSALREGRTRSARRDAAGIRIGRRRARHGLAVAPGQPVMSYVGCSLKELWAEPRIVIGEPTPTRPSISPGFSTAVNARRGASGQVGEQLASRPPRPGPAASQRVTSPRRPPGLPAANPLDKRVHSCVLACCKDQAALSLVKGRE